MTLWVLEGKDLAEFFFSRISYSLGPLGSHQEKWAVALGWQEVLKKVLML